MVITLFLIMVIRNEVENVDIICVDDAVDGR